MCLDDFKLALYVCPNHTDDGIYSDHGYLDTLDDLVNSNLSGLISCSADSFIIRGCRPSGPRLLLTLIFDSYNFSLPRQQSRV